jgi:multidrug efflux pump subunit AcrA (membrane-fusion protein)
MSAQLHSAVAPVDLGRAINPGLALPPAPPRRRRWWLWGVLFCLLAGGVGYFALAGHGTTPTAAAATKPKKTEPEVVPVVVEPITLRPVQRMVQMVGTLYGFEEVVIAAKVEGRIKRVLCDIGDRVKPGQPLLELDDTDYKLAEKEAQRNLELELAKLGLNAPPSDTFDVKQLPSVIRAETLLRNSESRLKRLKDSGSGVSREEREQGETDAKVAHANLQQAVLDAHSTLAAVRHKQSLLATAQQRLADTQLKAEPLSQNRLKDLQLLPPAVRSQLPPMEFVVAQRMATEGEMAKANMVAPVFRLVMDDPLKMQATLPERYIDEVKQGQQVQLQVEAYPTETFRGWVGRVNRTVNLANRTFQVEVLIPNADRRLHAGSFAKGAVLTRDAAAPMVPEEAIVTFAGVSKIFVVRDNKAVAIPVTTETVVEVKDKGRIRNWVEIQGDCKAGEPVVIFGQTKLVDGTAVRIRTAGK